MSKESESHRGRKSHHTRSSMKMVSWETRAEGADRSVKFTDLPSVNKF